MQSDRKRAGVIEASVRRREEQRQRIVAGIEHGVRSDVQPGERAFYLTERLMDKGFADRLTVGKILYRNTDHRIRFADREGLGYGCGSIELVVARLGSGDCYFTRASDDQFVARDISDALVRGLVDHIQTGGSEGIERKMIRSDALAEILNPCQGLVVLVCLTGNGNTHFFSFAGNDDLTAVLTCFSVRITDRERRGLINEVLLSDRCQRSREMRIRTAYFSHNVRPSDIDGLGCIGVIYHARTKRPFVGRSGESFEFGHFDFTEGNCRMSRSFKFQIASSRRQVQLLLGVPRDRISLLGE